MPVPKKLKEEMHPGSERNGSSTLYYDETSMTATGNNIFANGVPSVRALPIKSTTASNNKIGFRKKFSSSYDMKQQQQRSDDPFRFAGDGIDFKAKFIGEQDVMDARGDQMCQIAMQSCKARVKRSGEHKQRIWFNISLKGFKIKDQLTGVILFNFPVNKVSFIAKDITDNRAFGFVHGGPDEKHQFFAIKTEKSAKPVVFSIRDMFQIVYEIKKKQIEDAKQHHNSQIQTTPTEHQNRQEASDCLDDDHEDHVGVPVENLLDLELELENLEQGMRTMNDWAAFSSEENGNNENGQMVHSISAPNGYLNMENGQLKNITNSRIAQSEDSNTVSFDETFFNPIQTSNKPILHTNTNGNAVHINPLPPPLIVSSRRSHLNTNVAEPNSIFNNHAEFFTTSSISNSSSITTPLYNTQDPFDTSHVGQLLNDNSDKIHNEPFAVTSDIAMPRTISQTNMNGFHAQTPSFDILQPNYSALVPGNLITDYNLDPMISSPMQQSALTATSPSSGFDVAFEKLCNLETLSNASTQKLQTIGVIPTTSLSNLKQSSSKKSMNELRDEGGPSPMTNSFIPLVLSQKPNIPSSSSFSSLDFVNTTKPSSNLFFDENLMQQNTISTINGANNNNLPVIPPRSMQTTSALPRPEPNQRLNKGLLPPPLSTSGHGRTNAEPKGDPFADDFFS